MKTTKKYRDILYNTITTVGIVLQGDLDGSRGLYEGLSILPTHGNSRRETHQLSRNYVLDANLVNKDTDQALILKLKTSNEKL